MKDTSAQSVVLLAGKPDQRMYFFLKADTGEMREVSIRHLSLEGTPNFRDLGGYRTTDDRSVRWGLLYRSGYLGDLTPKDYSYLAGLDIHVVCDFRSPREREVSPEAWVPGSTTQLISLPIGTSPPKEKEANATPPKSSAVVEPMTREAMGQSYGEMAFTAADQFSDVFRQLEQDHLPLLYHCSAGRDRTGIFSALLLRALGIPEKTILTDYALTGEYLGTDPDSPVMRQMFKTLPPELTQRVTDMPPAERKEALVMRPEWIATMFRNIDLQYGSFDNYRRKALHVSDEDLQHLRDRLLQN